MFERARASPGSGKKCSLVGPGSIIMALKLPWQSGNCKQDLMIVRRAAAELAGNSVFLAIMRHIMDEPQWFEIKAVSHLGVVSLRGRAHDPGNYNYTAFWRILRQSLPPDEVLHSLHQRWPSLDHDNHAGMERCGDLLEYALGFWHANPTTHDIFTGIPSKQHLAFSQSIHNGMNAICRLSQKLGHNSSLNPTLWAEAFFQAASFHKIP